MVFCIIAFVVFGVLGIFSAKYRDYAKEAFHCFTQTAFLKPCTTGFDKKMQVRISTKLSKINPLIGKFVFKQFQLISVLFILLMFGSFFFSAWGAYNFFAFGNCNGPQSNEFCALNPESYNNFWNILFPPNPSQVRPVSSEGLPSIGPENAPIQMIEVGCFTCPFTKATESTIEKILQEYEGKIHFTFKYFPLKSHEYSFEAAEAAECARDQNKFWEFKKAVFLAPNTCTDPNQPNHNAVNLTEAIKNLGLNESEFNSCLASGKHKEFILQEEKESIEAGVYGTPTFYINGKVLVAPKSVSEFREIIDKELSKP
ncbi:MAG: thioredoxin domain-containing protein [Candidatus Diapherotrites archaeon]